MPEPGCQPAGASGGKEIEEREIKGGLPTVVTADRAMDGVSAHWGYLRHWLTRAKALGKCSQRQFL